MSKYKVKNSIWFVLFETLKIYFCNIDKFLVYMLFPVFGQLLGITLTFGLSLGFAEKIFNRVDSISTAILLILLLTIPGLLIFTKAFWDYMVAYVALNSMTEGTIATGKVYDFQSHNEVATRRVLPFILLLMLVSILSSLALNIFIIVPVVIWIYLILVYQIFTFEPELGITEIFKRSFSLIKGNWARTFFLMIILTVFSIVLIVQGVRVILDYLNLTNFLNTLFLPLTNEIPLTLVNKILDYVHIPEISPLLISQTIICLIIIFIVTGLTLPIRSICWSLWYMVLSEQNPPSIQTKTEKKQRRSNKAKRKNEYEE